MPWLKFKTKPEYLGKVIIESYELGIAIEIPTLENIIDSNTGKPHDPPAVIPVDKLTDDWKIGDEGKLLCNLPNNAGYVYYDFYIVESPVFSEELKERAKKYREKNEKTRIKPDRLLH
jgi:hypothetical protein